MRADKSAPAHCMADKLKTFLRVVAHTFFAFIAALFGGAMFNAFVRPIVGRERYRQTLHEPTNGRAATSYRAAGGSSGLSSVG